MALWESPQTLGSCGVWDYCWPQKRGWHSSGVSDFPTNDKFASGLITFWWNWAWFRSNYYTFTLILVILLIKIVVCRKFHWTKFLNGKCFHMRLSPVPGEVESLPWLLTSHRRSGPTTTRVGYRPSTNTHSVLVIAQWQIHIQFWSSPSDKSILRVVGQLVRAHLLSRADQMVEQVVHLRGHRIRLSFLSFFACIFIFFRLDHSTDDKGEKKIQWTLQRKRNPFRGRCKLHSFIA